MSDHGYIEVKNFEQFQHYKKRSPPWIKLHAALLDDYEFARLPDASKMHLMGIWILASKTGNRIPADSEWIARKIGATSAVDLQLLIGTGFLKRLRRASDVQAVGKQNHLPEGETESESEAETEAEQRTVPTEPAGRSVELVEEEEPEPSPTEGQVLATVRRVLWAPDGRPPADDGTGKPWSEGREIKVIRALVERGETTDDLIRAVHGLRLLQDRGDVDWLAPNAKVTLRAVYNSKNGSRDMLTQALDAYASGPPPPEPKPKSGQRREDAKRADFLAGVERLKRVG
jgi:hypothetical protein